MTRRLPLTLAAAGILVLAGGDAAAEPMFLSKAFPRCSTCHVSPTGGRLLNDFGRTMSHLQLPTFRAADPSAADSPNDEQAFLWGALGDALGPVRLGIALRPSHLQFRFPGGSSDRNLLMQADLQGAYSAGAVTLYASVGRLVEGSNASISSREHWISYEGDGGLGLRAGRFLPAYGVRFADHTTFNRDLLGLGQDDQIYGVEVSHQRGRSLLQVSLAPGRAESLLDDDGTQAWTSAGRWQFDVTPRAVLLASGVYRSESDLAPASGSGGVAVGFSPGSRMSIWTQLDGVFTERAGVDTSWVFVNETAVETLPGLWLKVSPQYRKNGDSRAGDVGRLVMGTVWIPRTHWNVNVSYYRDRNRQFDVTTSLLMAQLHLFL